MRAPKHRKAELLFEQKFFERVRTFRELESRIAALPTSQERGAAFEVFAEAYLATQPAPQAKQVYPFDVLPPSLKQRLGLGKGRDMGVDGVFEARLGQFNAYQVKFRTGRPSLSWDELSTFMGLTDQVSQRVLFTNCNDLPPLMNERHGFYCIRGSDLDKLEPHDFEAIVAWSQGTTIARARKQPRPHQLEALDAILSALRQRDRVTSIMACGTGKTLVALWVAERTKSHNVLVLVPSLALLRQTLHEWLRETRWQDFSYLCVCSDPTVDTGVDELAVRQSDLDFPVTTDDATVHQYLSKDSNDVRIVFSTYQSAKVVARAFPPAFQFDLAIFDEAHKTAGREGRNFAFALDDENLPIKKRLFLTATPRHYDVLKRDNEGDAKLVYSMDVPEVYGPVAHTLTFAEAARRGIICNYNVIISVVTSDMVNDHLLQHGNVLVKGEEIHARQVANQLALKAAVEKHAVNKIFTFHRSVASARSFTSDSGEGVGNHLSEFRAFHVNGTMPTLEREGYMNEFRAAPKAVMSNARCLTEGVDVPAVDMVAFLTPKRSKVDIVQATGRAMRKADGKTTGYILVPLFVEQAKGETIEEAIQRTEFDEVWNVLQAMQEQDEVLADIIRQMREERGRKKGFDETRFNEKVEILGPAVSLDSLCSSITAKCITCLGDLWEERYGELRDFKERFGHCNVPWTWAENIQLAVWVRTQRQFKYRGILIEERVIRLTELGFVWDPRDARWEEMCASLEEYRTQFGDCNVPWGWSPNPPLAGWASLQRQVATRGKMPENRTRRLNEMGFTWDTMEAAWIEMFSALVQYKKSYGNCNVPSRWRENRKLSTWVAWQRLYKRQGILAADRIQQLNDLGFVWEPHDAFWEEMFSALLQYKSLHGNCNVPVPWTENPRLSKWVIRQRAFWKLNQLAETRLQRLDAIGFAWDLDKNKWEQMFRELVAYKKLHGDCDVPKDSTEIAGLALWVINQRIYRNREQLSEEYRRRLDEVGFAWGKKAKPKDVAWEEMFLALLDYKRAHGNCNVPNKYSVHPQLGYWVANQRWVKKCGRLSQDRINRLHEIGFQWKLKT